MPVRSPSPLAHAEQSSRDSSESPGSSLRHLRGLGSSVPVGQRPAPAEASPDQDVTAAQPAGIATTGRDGDELGADMGTGLSDGGSGSGAHGGESAGSPAVSAVDPHGVVVERDNRVSAHFEAANNDELYAQVKAFLKGQFPSNTRSLSKVRQAATETAATLISNVLANIGKGGFAEWARRLADKGKQNGPSRQWVATLGQPWGPRATLADLLLLPKSARIALWLALLARETATPDDDPGELIRETHRADHQADDTDLDTMLDGVVKPDEAARLEADHTRAGNQHLMVAAWARRIRESGVVARLKA